MWALETPWYELIIRAIVLFFFLFLVMRMWGKKHFGELNPFDFLLLLIMSESVQNVLVDDEKSITGGLISLSTLFILNVILNRLSYRSQRLERYIDGVPKVLVQNGKVDEQAKARLRLTDQELEEALRLEGVMDLASVKEARMETNGHISVVKDP